VNVDGLVARLAARQYGLLTLEQLERLGMTRGMRRQRVEDGRLRLVRRFVYGIVGAPPSWSQIVLAAVLAAGPDAAASDVTAATIWGFKHCDRGGRIHVTAPHQLRLDGVKGHLRALERGQRLTRSGIPVTSPERTIFDLAATLSTAKLGECVDDALRRDLIRLARLRQLVEGVGHSGRRRIRPLRLVLADRISGYDSGGSDWEREMDRQWDAWGLPPSVRQHRVRANGHAYVLDRAIPELKIGIEWNGFETHGTRSAHSAPAGNRTPKRYIREPPPCWQHVPREPPA
jgi:hypothetical protein